MTSYRLVIQPLSRLSMYSSPLAHIPGTVPQRTVYFCVQGQYRDAIRDAMTAFKTAVLKLKYDLISTGDSAAVSIVDVLQSPCAYPRNCPAEDRVLLCSGSIPRCYSRCNDGLQDCGLETQV